jgi:hypothetical protein
MGVVVGDLACAKGEWTKHGGHAARFPFATVSHLMSHALALDAGIGGQGLWSVLRGLARGLTDRANTSA